jgi:hypothetical protein
MDPVRPSLTAQAARGNVERKRVRELLSKLVAGGLSAAVILLWWPRFFPVDNATTWLVRGVLWTLSFELLLHALVPVERALWDTRAGEKVRGGASKVRTRSMRGRAAIACSALAVPAALLTFAPAPPAKHVAVAPVRHVTEVKRIVKVERKQVRVAQVVPVPAAPAAPAAPARSYSAPAQPRQTAKPAAPTPQKGNGTKSNGTTSSSQGATSPQPDQQQPVSAPRVVRRSGPA